MNILKSAQQKNFVVDREMYTSDKLLDLVKRGVIFSFDEKFEHKNFECVWDINLNDEFRIYASDCNEIKVIYNKDYGFYQVIVITKAGEQIPITI